MYAYIYIYIISLYTWDSYTAVPIATGDRLHVVAVAAQDVVTRPQPCVRAPACSQTITHQQWLTLYLLLLTSALADLPVH